MQKCTKNICATERANLNPICKLVDQHQHIVITILTSMKWTKYIQMNTFQGKTGMKLTHGSFCSYVGLLVLITSATRCDIANAVSRHIVPHVVLL